MYRSLQRLAGGTAVLLTALLPGAAAAWDWSVTPYGWGIDVNTDTAVEQPSGPDIQFSELVDVLDFAGQVLIEGRGPRFGVLVDLTSLQVSDRRLRGPFEVDTDTEVTLAEIAGTVDVSGGEGRTALLFGVRHASLDLQLEFETTGPLALRSRVGEDVTIDDVMIGIMHIGRLAERWSFALRADVATGDTDFSWNVGAHAGFNWSESGTLWLGYRHLDLDFGDVGDMSPEIVVTGPQVGATFRF